MQDQPGDSPGPGWGAGGGRGDGKDAIPHSPSGLASPVGVIYRWRLIQGVLGGLPSTSERISHLPGQSGAWNSATSGLRDSDQPSLWMEPS